MGHRFEVWRVFEDRQRFRQERAEVGRVAEVGLAEGVDARATLDLLREWWKARPNRDDAGTPMEERWLFPGKRGKPMTTRQLSRLFHEATDDEVLEFCRPLLAETIALSSS